MKGEMVGLKEDLTIFPDSLSTRAWQEKGREMARIHRIIRHPQVRKKLDMIEIQRKQSHCFSKLEHIVNRENTPPPTPTPHL